MLYTQEIILIVCVSPVFARLSQMIGYGPPPRPLWQVRLCRPCVWLAIYLLGWLAHAAGWLGWHNVRLWLVEARARVLLRWHRWRAPGRRFSFN